MTQTKRKRKNHRKKRKTRRRANVPKEDMLIANTVKDVIHDKLYKEYRSRFVNNPSLLTLTELETILQHSIRQDLTRKNSYSPSINKRLISIKSVRQHPLFNCSNLSPLENTATRKQLKIMVTNNGKSSCEPVYSPLAKQAFLNALQNDKILCNKLILPIQLHTNCWFNTMLMCIFISDKGRKFFRFLRQAMIEGKLTNGKEIEPKSLQESFVLFNAAIEAVQNKDNFLSNSSLALNTNAIIKSIYKSIPKTYIENHRGLKNVDEYGNPLSFYRDLINYIDDDNSGSPTLKIISNNEEAEEFLSGKSRQVSDIVALQLYSLEYSPSKALANRLKKGTNVQAGSANYLLDSVAIRNNDHNHFACAITCNRKEMIYDGAAFTKIASRKWKNLLNKNKDWKLPGSSTKWNFTKGYQILFYYRI